LFAYIFFTLYMRKIIKIIQILHLFLLTLILSSSAMAGQYKVTRVYDGDTILCAGNDTTIKVRLVGIDAPETSKNKRDPGQPYSQQAKKFLSGLVLNKNIEMKGYGLDKYNRTLGEIFIESKNINLEMVKQGLAEAYKGKSPKGFKDEPYIEAEKETKGSSKGMWTLGNKYISPADWRKNGSKNRNR
jgi:micrococcal nuclease